MPDQPAPKDPSDLPFDGLRNLRLAEAVSANKQAGERRALPGIVPRTVIERPFGAQFMSPAAAFKPGTSRSSILR